MPQQVEELSIAASISVLGVVALKASGHDWGDWEEVEESTCSKPGLKVRICKNDPSHREYNDVPLLMHSLQKTEAIEPSCVTSGNIEYYTCERCGEMLADEDQTKEINEAEVIIPALGHSYGDWVVVEHVTCTDNGSKERICSRCNRKEITEIPANGHANITDPAVDPTCTEGGLTEGVHCSVCGTILTEQKTIPALGHDWEDGTVVEPPTCTEKGSKTVICSRCNVTDTVEIPASGHTWDTGEVTTKPSTSANGVKTYTCTICGEIKTELVAKLNPAMTPAPDPILGNLASLETRAKVISENGDPVGSTFSDLQVKSKKIKKTSITFAWAAVPKATGYVIYGAPCGSKYAKLATTKSTSYTQGNLKKSTYYKYFVSAHDKYGNILATSKTIHIATSGGKKGNTKSVMLNKKKKTLKVGKTFKLKATLKNGKLKVSKHRKVAYESDNPKVATVSKSGKVKAVGKGTCYVYAYAQNGVFAKCKITVK